MNGPMYIDANNLIMRNIMASALDDLKAGEVFTGGVYGTLRQLSTILKTPECRSDQIVAFFDGGVPKHRTFYIPEFKAERKEQKELLTPEQKEKAYVQLDLCWEMFELLGITVAKWKDREADDAVAAAVKCGIAADLEPLVVSGDRDLFQTVAMGGVVWYLKDRLLVDKLNFSEVTGVTPQAFLLYRALSGDSSDGVKGAGGVGPKRAADLIHELAGYVDEASHGGYSYYDMSAEEQLREMVNYLNNPTVRKKRPAYEDNIIQSYGRLVKVIKGIDLTNSFGWPETMKRKLAEVPEPPAKIPFLRFCHRLKFKSVLGSPDTYFRPFQDAYERRLSSREA